MHIFADQISKVTLSNGNLRVQLTLRGSNNETIYAGTLIEINGDIMLPVVLCCENAALKVSDTSIPRLITAHIRNPFYLPFLFGHIPAEGSSSGRWYDQEALPALPPVIYCLPPQSKSKKNNGTGYI